MDKILCHRPMCGTQSRKLSLPVEIVEAKGHQLRGKTISDIRAEMDSRLLWTALLKFENEKMFI